MLPTSGNRNSNPVATSRYFAALILMFSAVLFAAIFALAMASSTASWHDLSVFFPFIASANVAADTDVGMMNGVMQSLSSL